MLISKNTKTVIFKLDNPNRITDVIPTAKVINFRGATLTVVPHGLDETKVLRNMGFDVPPPITYHYDWPGLHKPYDHQRRTAEFLTLHNKALVLNEIGTGKTLSVLWGWHFLRKASGRTSPTLIVSPLSTLERVWGDTIYLNFPDVRACVLHGTAEKRRKLLAANYDVYIINHDGIGVVYKELVDKGFEFVIIDEAAVLRNPSTRRFKLIRNLCNGNSITRLWLLTGTPTPNEPTDAWSLAKLLDPIGFNRSYSNLKDKVMMKVGLWKWVPRPEAPEIISSILKPSIRFTRDECLDLPETIVQTRQVEMTVEQKTAYNKMLRNLVAEVKSSTITAANEVVKMLKLVQIVCGVAYDEFGSPIVLDCHPRVNLVKEIVEEAGQKVIIFVPLTGVLHMLNSELSKHWSTAMVYGGTSPTERNKIFYDFQHSADPHILIAHPGTMSHGLTLTEASTIIWYGPIPSNDQYVQACGRIERIGKKGASNVVHIESTDLEHRMYERLQSKQKLQGLLLDLIEKGKVDIS